MKVVKNKIIEATETELFGIYCSRDDLCYAFTFFEYKRRMKDAGCKINIDNK